MIQVKFKRMTDTAKPFSYSREGDACMDMYADENIVLMPHQTCIIPTGIAVELPSGYEGLVRGRSGLATDGITVHLGTIDETYRGNVGIIVTNTRSLPFVVQRGMRVAQFTVKPVYKITLEEVDTLSSTARGENGYGSSGI